MNTNKYYVYGYIDPTTEEYIYIGSGTNDRVNMHVMPHCYGAPDNRHKPFYKRVQFLVENGTQPTKVIIRDNMARKEARNLEKKLIKHYGRVGAGDGTLLNIISSMEIENAECPWCGTRVNTNGPRFSYFKDHHFSRCFQHPDNGGDDIRGKAKVSNVKTKLSILLDDCESMEEFYIRREFYGYEQGDVTGDQVTDYYIGYESERTLYHKPFNDHYLYPSYSFCSKDLLDYSLHGISALKV